MQIKSELCHITKERAVVRASAWNSDECLGSALGEGDTSETAEERAIQRLLNRLNQGENTSSVVRKQNIREIKGNELKEYNNQITSTKEDLPLRNIKDESKSAIENKGNHISTEGDSRNDVIRDWSNELTKLDIELKRIGWGKKEESDFINNIFGYKTRVKMTDYSDLILLITELSKIGKGTKVEDANKNNNVSNLIIKNNQILEKLGWNHEKARSFLASTIGSKSRKELSVDKLLRFNQHLQSLLDN